MQPPPLLTIAIPTYNRRLYLERLLQALLPLPEPLAGRIEVIVSDNASPDDTEELVSAFVRRFPALRGVRNPKNIGPEHNVDQCFRLARGEYLWVIGDDDMPKAGALEEVVRVLDRLRPDLVYIPSEWMANVLSPDQGAPWRPSKFGTYKQLAFARRVNVWFTFLSGIIVRRALGIDGAEAEHVRGTSLPQMGWVLPALKNGRVFCAFQDALVLATGGNSGGYDAVRVFGSSLSRLLAREFGRGSPIHDAIMRRVAQDYLPQLLWQIRVGKERGFHNDVSWQELRTQLGRYPAFWCFVTPVARAPRPFAHGALWIARALSKARRLAER